jgi:hypothetical protein
MEYSTENLLPNISVTEEKINEAKKIVSFLDEIATDNTKNTADLYRELKTFVDNKILNDF